MNHHLKITLVIVSTANRLQHCIVTESFKNHTSHCINSQQAATLHCH
uniref:Uncharacterized protein n=1 Tax=Arundo donax TaxID=35708 RepID=A0A0A9B6B7_ARUDO